MARNGTGDAYRRGRSGYSVKDEKDADKYSRDIVRTAKSDKMPAYEVSARGRTSKDSYLRNTKTEKGRGINASNVKTVSDDVRKAAERSKRGKRLSGKRL